MAITDINLSGKVRADDGSAVSGASVTILETSDALTGDQEGSAYTTTSTGRWTFTETTLTETYDVKISSAGGGQVRYIPWSDEITLKTVDTSVMKVRGVASAAAPIYLFADRADDAGDAWRIQASASDTLAIGSDKASAGTIIDYITITNGATAAASNTTILGQLTIGVDDTGADVKFFGATSGQYLLWDESADELVLAGDTKLSFHDAAGGENIIASANGHLEVNAGTTLDITAPTVDLNSSTEFNIDTAIYDLNASGAVTIDAAGLTTITGTNNAVGAIYLRANAGTSETLKIHSDQGTSVTEGAESVTILSDAGGVGIRSTANLANAVNVTVDGGTTSTMTLFNDTGTTATEGSASIQLLSDVGGINIKSGLNGANAVLLTADGGTSETIVVHADQGTGTGSIELLSDAGGIELDAGTDIILDAGGADIFLKDDGTLFGTLTNSSGELVIKSSSSGTTAATFSGANVTLAGTVGSGAITSSGIVKTDDATEATSTTDGSLQTDGGLSVVKDAVFGDDVKLLSDSAVLAFGADGDATLTHTNDTGLTLNSTNKLMFNDASQFVQGSSATVISIGATDEIDLTATAVDLNGTLDVSGNAQLSGTVTVGSDGSGTDVILYSGTSGDNLTWDASEEVLQITGTNGATALDVLDGDLRVVDTLYLYDRGGETLSSDGTDMTIASGGDIVLASTASVFINETANGNSTVGLTINMGANDDKILTLKSSDVSHAMTANEEADTFGTFSKSQSTSGGLNIQGYKDADGSKGFAYYVSARLGEAADTTKSTGAVGVIYWDAAVTDGSTNVAAVGSNGNLAVLTSNGTTRFIFDAEGSGHADVEWVAFDTYDDVALMDAVQSVSVGRMTPARYGDNSLYYNKEYLEATGIIGRDSWHEEDGKPRQMVNFTKLSMLHHGAILQIGDTLQTTEERLHVLEGKLLALEGGN